MTAQDVLVRCLDDAEVSLYVDAGAVPFGHIYPDDVGPLATNLLNALKAAGYAVVELPEPQELDGPDWRGEDWSVWPDLECSPHELVVRASVSLRIADARNFAAALLAAADAAEAR